MMQRIRFRANGILFWTLLVVLIGLIFYFGGVGCAKEGNLVDNGGFELDFDQDGCPDEWAIAGHSEIRKSLVFGKGRTGLHSAELICTDYVDLGANSYVMLFQKGRVSVNKGNFYKLVFWAKQKGMRTGCVSVALRDTNGWHECGLNQMFQLSADTRDWEKFSFIFEASRDCSDTSRLQFWHRETGTLWIDDVEMFLLKGGVRRPTEVIPAQGNRNLVPNSSFECGTDGWGSLTLSNLSSYGGLDGLIGELDASLTWHGGASMKIDIAPEKTPVYYFDYFKIIRKRVKSSLLGTVGWIRVKKNREYTLSAYLKSRKGNIAARLGLFSFPQHPQTKIVWISEQWKRYSVVISPKSEFCFIVVGIDLDKAKRDYGTLWVDAVQFEEGSHLSAYRTAGAIEIGVSTDKVGNIFDYNEQIKTKLAFYNSTDKSETVSCDLEITDFFDKIFKGIPISVQVPPKTAIVRKIDLRFRRKGFFRLHARARWQGGKSEKKMRLAVISDEMPKDSFFGLNHAYGRAHILRLCKRAGISWVRDWALKWEEIEPKKGKYFFSSAEEEIGRIQIEGMKVLGLLPFPSSNWASSAPSEVITKNSKAIPRARMAYPPKYINDFMEYNRRTVGHFKGTIQYWQVFNEPMSGFALPRKAGFNSEDYVSLVKTAWLSAKKADPECKIVIGFRGLGSLEMLRRFDKIFRRGALKYCDAVSVHCYPRIMPPEEYEESTRELNKLMAEYGERRPIWVTEHGYYCDDDPAEIPPRFSRHTTPLKNEEVHAAYAIRFATILLANGAEKIFYHAGKSTKLNRDNIEGIFFEYGGAPRKIYSAVAAFSSILPPQAHFVKKLYLDDSVMAYLFGYGKKTVVVVWQPEGHTKKTVVLKNKEIHALDIMSNPIDTRKIKLTQVPIYFLTSSLTGLQLESSLQILN